MSDRLEVPRAWQRAVRSFLQKQAEVKAPRGELKFRRLRHNLRVLCYMYNRQTKQSAKRLIALRRAKTARPNSCTASSAGQNTQESSLRLLPSKTRSKNELKARRFNDTHTLRTTRTRSIETSHVASHGPAQTAHTSQRSLPHTPPKK